MYDDYCTRVWIVTAILLLYVENALNLLSCCTAESEVGTYTHFCTRAAMHNNAHTYVYYLYFTLHCNNMIHGG